MNVLNVPKIVISQVNDLNEIVGQQFFVLNNDLNRWVLGRDLSCDLVIYNDPFVSRKHCTFLKIKKDEEFVWQLVDGLCAKSKGSQYGLWKNKKKVIFAELKHNDIFQISNTTSFQFIYETQDDLLLNEAKTIF